MPPQPDTSLDLYHLKMLIILDKSNRKLFKRSSFRRVSYRANICTRIICNQWRHKITIIYGNRLAVYIHTWLICDVTKRQLCTRGYYYTTYSSLTNLEAVSGHCALQLLAIEIRTMILGWKVVCVPYTVDWATSQTSTWIFLYPKPNLHHNPNQPLP